MLLCPNCSVLPFDGCRNLLSPRRKALYAMFAFAPGTILGVFLYSVKQDMEREDDRLRMQAIESEMEVENRRARKDQALEAMIENLNERLSALEQQKLAATAANAATQQTARSASTAAKPLEPKPAELNFWEQQKQAFHSFVQDAMSSKDSSATKEAPLVSSTTTAPSGIQGRAQQRDRERLAQDVRVFKAKQEQESRQQ